MNNITEQNLPFYWSFKCLEYFYNNGVRHIVISPGSRSTPLTMAAAAHKGFKKHIILDERTAAFFALGIGKATGIPALLICTSGTAVANYYPAIIEARKSRVPLIALTADRPPRLHGTGANQTMNQQHIFGDYPLFYEDVGIPSNKSSYFYDLQSVTINCFNKVIDRKGPAHLNFPFDKPLEPNVEFVAETADSFVPSMKSESTSSKNALLEPSISAKINEAEKPLLVIGQLPAGVSASSCFKLAKKINAPVLSEAGHLNQRLSIQQFDGFLRKDESLSKLKPDLILRFGLQPASKGLLQALKTWKPTTHIYFSVAEMWSDVASSVTRRSSWNGYNFDLTALDSKDETWLSTWKDNESSHSEDASAMVQSEAALTDGHIYHHLSRMIPEEWFIFFSNSFSARDRSLFGHWNDQKTFTNRGVSGIDGITSSAMGTSIGLEEPSIGFIGDLAFFHDTNALLNHHKLTRPLVLVVLNNSGGSIFRMLPIAEHHEYFNTYFETPQKADISKLAASYGINYTRVEEVDELKSLELQNLNKSSTSKLHIVECVTDPNQSMKLRNKLWGND